MEAYRSGHNGHDWKSCSLHGLRGSNPLASATGTHAKGAYKTPTRVSFSMQNRGELPFLWQFTLFVVSSRIAVGICFSLALKSRKPLTIAQKGFLHDKERMISSVLIKEKMTDRTLMNAVGRLLIRFPLPVCQTRIIRTLQKRRYLCAFLQILGWCTYSTTVLTFATNHQKYRRFCCMQV